MGHKTLAISSQGGHWIQLNRLLPAFVEDELILASTFKKTPELPDSVVHYYSVSDASRWNKWLLVKQSIQVFKLVLKEKPDKIVTTGASIGIWAIISGRLIGSTTIWIDSIANYSKISLSGRLVRYVANYHLTQWPHLMHGKTIYKHSVL